MQRLDPDGVPSLIQRLVYLGSGCWWRATLFNGVKVTLPAELVHPQPPLTSMRPTKLETLAAYDQLTKCLEENFEEISRKYGQISCNLE